MTRPPRPPTSAECDAKARVVFDGATYMAYWAGFEPKVECKITGGVVTYYVDEVKLPVRQRGESEAEFVERVRRMP